MRERPLTLSAAPFFSFNKPQFAFAVLEEGAVYICDTGNDMLKRYDMAKQTIETVWQFAAGEKPTSGYQYCE